MRTKVTATLLVTLLVQLTNSVNATYGCTDFETLWGACRTTTGDYGTYTKPTCSNCSADKCMKLCSDNPACVAFEFNSEEKYCEIHTEAITHADPNVPNTKCGVCKSGGCPLSNKKAHLMYQTRTTIDADFGVKVSGLTPRQNADKICREKIPEGHACSVGSKFEVRAFVSIDGNDQLKDWANYGIPGFDPSGPVYGLEETWSDKIGSSWGSLFDGNIDKTLDAADILNSGYWWSGSTWNGAARTSYTCKKDGIPWSTDSDKWYYKAQYGRRDRTSSSWLANGSSGHCDSSSKYLLCTCHCKGGPQNELTPSPTKAPVKAPTDSPTPAPTSKPTRSPVEPGSGCTDFKTLWGACRTTTGDYGTYTNPTCNDCTADKCMALCSNNPACVAFEFSSNTKNCEIHTEAITHADPNVSNTKCGVCKSGECPLSNKKAHLMYQTRQTVDADFGVKESGLTPRQNADKICREKIPEGHACAVGSKFKVRAFVSIDGNDQLKDWANYGIPGFDPSGPVYGLEETSSDKIGSSWGSLFDGNIDKTLDDADILNSGYWWSGSTSDGTARTAYTCKKNGIPWSTDSGSDDYKAQYGRRDRTSSSWLANGSSGHCDSSSKYLLCTCHCIGDPQDNLTLPPTTSPVSSPTDSPTPAPSNKPTDSPTPAPTDAPTDSPTYVPTDAPTPAPSNKPTDSPTPAPTDAPTDSPTFVPTDAPTPAPSNKPTDSPTPAPTDAPTDSPTHVPTDAPTPAPTNRPTRSPFELGDGCTNFVTLPGACRTSDGTKGTYYEANCQSCTVNKCKALCSSDPACVAFELSPNGCEIHTEYIAYAEPMKDVTCGVCNTLPGVCPSGDSSAVLTYSTVDPVPASFGVAESGLSPRQNADKFCRDLIPQGHGCNLSGAYTVRAFVSIDENDQLSDWPTYGLQGFDPNGKVYGWSDQAGYQVGSSWSSLFDGSIDQSLSSAGILTQGYWWSGSNTDGTVVATHTCKANGIPWSTSSGSSSFLSVFGKRDTAGSDWIYNTRSGHCDSSSKRLLCACYCRGPQDSLTFPPTTSPTASPTESPTKYPTESPTKYPTESPTKYPTESPTKYPTESPTKYPTESPTKYPTESPTKYPTESPTKYPTESPTKYPTESPTKYPTESPTKYPTESPTKYPTESPTKYPTDSPVSAPTESPTKYPTESPTKYPTESPTKYPTESPTKYPTESPTKYPTESPTKYPTESPTNYPTASPVDTPTSAPTAAPSAICERYEFNPFTGVNIFGDGDPNDAYGSSISSGPGVIVIGAPGDDNPNGSTFQDAGAVYIQRFGLGSGIVRNNPDQKLHSPNVQAQDRFGASVAVTKDEKFLVVGAPNDDNHGTAMVFSRDINIVDSDYSHATTLIPPNHPVFGNPKGYYKCGTSVSICTKAGQSVIAVGCPAKAANADVTTNNIPGLVLLYSMDLNGNWQLISQFTSPNGALGDQFGYNVHTNCDTLVVGAPHTEGPNNEVSQGEAYIFKLPINLNNFNPANYQRIEHPKCGVGRDCSLDRFGWSVSSSPNDKWVAIGAPWEEKFGGASKVGHVHMYMWNPALNLYSFWSTLFVKNPINGNDVTPGGSRFGYSHSLDNDVIVIGAIEAPILSDSGAAFPYYAAASGEWVAGDVLFRSANTADGDMYGISVSICGPRVAIGAPMHDLHHGQTVMDTGSAMLIDREYFPGCVPTESPTHSPTNAPSLSPTDAPTKAPTPTGY